MMSVRADIPNMVTSGTQLQLYSQQCRAPVFKMRVNQEKVCLKEWKKGTAFKGGEPKKIISNRMNVCAAPR